MSCILIIYLTHATELACLTSAVLLAKRPNSQVSIMKKRRKMGEKITATLIRPRNVNIKLQFLSQGSPTWAMHE